MSEQEPRFLKQKTIERFAREWENRPRTEPFSIRASVRNGDEDIIEAHEGSQEEWAPEGTPHRGMQEAIEEMQFMNSGDLIADNEMERDLQPGYIPPWEHTDED